MNGNPPLYAAPDLAWAYYIATPDSRVCSSIPLVNGNGDFACVKFGHHGAANAARGDYARANPSFFFCNITIKYSDVPPNKSLGLWLQEAILEKSFLRGGGVFRHIPYGNEWFKCFGNDQNLRDLARALEFGQPNLENALSNAIQTQRNFVNQIQQESQRAPRLGLPNNDFTWLTTPVPNNNNRTGRELLDHWTQQNDQQAIQARYLARPNLQAMWGFLSWFEILESAMQNLAARLGGIRNVNFPQQINVRGQFDFQQLDNVLAALQAPNILQGLVAWMLPTNIAANPGVDRVTSASVKFLDNNVVMILFVHYLRTQ